jgi:hypothetical protein
VEGTDSSASTNIAASNGVAIGCGSDADTRRFKGLIGDPTIHYRALSLPEIQILANRSDPMLGGLIVAPRRKYFPVKQSILTSKQYTRLGRLILSSRF